MEFRVKHCDFMLSFSCFSQVFLGVMPTLFLIPLAKKSYTGTKYALNKQTMPPVTAIHLCKCFLIGVLACLPLVIMAEEIVKEETLSFSASSIFHIFTSFNWIISLFLVRKEYKAIGYTSLYLRLFWLVDFCCSTLLTLSDFRLSTKITNGEALSICYLFFLAFLNIYGWLHIRDSSPVSGSTKMIDDYFRLVDIEKGVSKQYQLQEKLIDTKNAFKNPTVPEIIEDTSIQPSYKNKTLTRENFKSSLSQKEAFDISVVSWESAFRDERSTTLYIITYQMDGDRRSAKRSYSEFFRLYKKTLEKFPTQSMPPFPEKKNAEESSQRVVILERKEIFDKFLKLLCHKKLYTRHFLDFIKSTEEIPYFGYLSRRKGSDSPDSLKSKSNQTPNSIVTTNEKLDQTFSSSLGKNNIFEWEGVQFITDSFQECGTRSYYTIDIVTGAYRGNNIHYGIKVSYKKSFLTFERTYTDFEELHKKMEDYSNEPIPEFPGRGRLGILSLKNDEGLLEFSRCALKEYLKLIASEKKLQDCPDFIEFFKIDNCF